MAIVDASVLLQTVYEEEYSEEARAVFKDAEMIQAPEILWFEIGSAIVKLLRRGLISDTKEAITFLRTLVAIPITMIEINRTRTLTLAQELQISYYDASYVDAALEAQTDLYTADDALFQKASSRVNVVHLRQVERRKKDAK